MASVESKIASAITGVAAAIVFAFVVVPEIKERRAAAAMNKAMTEFQAEMERETARLSRQQEEAMRQAQRARAAHEASMQLRPGEKCLGGSVVRVVQVDGVPSYIQVSSNGRPIRCAGNKRI
jgi:Sec-independent protein translocase protein TatA